MEWIFLSTKVGKYNQNLTCAPIKGNWKKSKILGKETFCMVLPVLDFSFATNTCSSIWLFGMALPFSNINMSNMHTFWTISLLQIFLSLYDYCVQFSLLWPLYLCRIVFGIPRTCPNITMSNIHPHHHLSSSSNYDHVCDRLYSWWSSCMW